jgi:hypothetical protein
MSPVATVAYYQMLGALKGVEVLWLLIGWIYLGGIETKFASNSSRVFPTPIQLDLKRSD